MSKASKGVGRRRLRRVLLPVGILMAVFATSVPGAQALEQYHYGGVSLQPGEKREALYGGSNALIGNIAEYTGAGNTTVCQSTWNYYKDKTQRTCGVNIAGSALNNQAWWGDYVVPYIENGGSTAHTIHGWRYTTYDTLGNAWGKPGGLHANERIESPNFKFSFRMQTDGNAVVYNNQTGVSCWSTQTSLHPGSWSTLQPDGNFVVYGGGVAEGGTPSWYNTGTVGNSGAYMKMQNDGNLVIYTWQGTPIWATSFITGKLGC